MSLFKVLGSIGKSVGKVALGVGKTAANVAGTYVGVGPLFGSGGSQTAASAPVAPSTAAVAGTGPVANTSNSPSLNGGLLGSLTGFLNSASSALLGKTHIQVDGNLGTGGREVDSSASSTPSWLMPAAIGGGALLLISMLLRRR